MTVTADALLAETPLAVVGEGVPDLREEEDFVRGSLLGIGLAGLPAFGQLVHRHDDTEVEGRGHDEEVDDGGDEKARLDGRRPDVECADFVEAGLAEDGGENRRRILSVSASMIGLKAAPMMTPTARSMTLPRMMNFLKPSSMD